MSATWSTRPRLSMLAVPEMSTWRVSAKSTQVPRSKLTPYWLVGFMWSGACRWVTLSGGSPATAHASITTQVEASAARP